MKSKAQFKVVEDSVRRQLPKHVFFFFLSSTASLHVLRQIKLLARDNI